MKSETLSARIKMFDIICIPKSMKKPSVGDRIELNNDIYAILHIEDDKNYYDCKVKKLKKVAWLVPNFKAWDGVSNIIRNRMEEELINNDVTIVTFDSSR